MRAVLSLCGGLLMVVGLACGFGGLAILTVGPPARWLDGRPAIEPRIAIEVWQRGVLYVRPADDGPEFPHESPSSDESSTSSTDEAPTSDPEAADASSAQTTAPTAASSAVTTAATVASSAVTTAATAAVPFRPITRIVMPSIRLASEVTPAKLLKRDGGMTWDIPARVAGHAETSAGVGGPGNAVLLGHVVSRDAGNVFNHLDRARVGDLVRVFSDEEYFDYRVVDIREVPRTDTSVLDPTETASLSLITCAGAWMPFVREYAERLVVRAELDGPMPGGVATGASADKLGAAARMLFDESFVDNRNGWRHDPASTTRFAGGGYRLTGRTPGRFVAIGAPIARVFRDVEGEGVFRKGGGPPGGGYGLIVRRQTPPGDGVFQGGRYYVLEVGDRGEVGVWRREEDRWVDLISWTPSEVVRPGNAINQLAVRATGTQLAFVVNGVEVANVDATLADGGVGIFVGGDFNDVVVERFVIRE